jgi:hypothetical protein
MSVEYLRACFDSFNRGDRLRTEIVHLRGGMPVLAVTKAKSRFLLLPQCDEPDTYVAQLAASTSALDPSFHEVILGVSGYKDSLSTVARGIYAGGLHAAIAEYVGLPSTWRGSIAQHATRALEPLRLGGESRARVVPLTLLIENESMSSTALLDAFGAWGGRYKGKINYLRAEAGKGKSTILAHFTATQLQRDSGPLPIYIPMRLLSAHRGISLTNIGTSVGLQPDLLSLAVTSGLATLILDGLDEVSGRYDPVVVREILQLCSAELLSPQASIVISGRTTESTQLERTTSRVISAELPSPESDDFREYVHAVVAATAPEWKAIATGLPALGILASDDTETPAHTEQLVDWVSNSFEHFGRDRSLFFVQSLAGLGRTRQLDGNKPLYLSADRGQKWNANLHDVAYLAAALACVRECSKIDPIAAERFTAEKQLDVLSLFALMASHSSASRLALPSANACVQAVFEIDPVHENEIFTACVRQLQKHALLFNASDGVRAGDWTPHFLSEWMRASLQVRLLLRSGVIQRYPCLAGVSLLDLLASSERSRLAFASLLPLALQASSADNGVLTTFLAKMVEKANAGDAEACANFWSYLSASEARSDLERPERLADLSDLSGLEFYDAQLGGEFSSNTCVFVETVFDGCTLVNCDFTACEMTGATFTRCTFVNVRCHYCDGPVLFEDCVFEDSQVGNFRNSENAAGAQFIGCDFRGRTLLRQDAPVSASAFGPAFDFSECRSMTALDELLGGDALGLVPRRISGIEAPGAKATLTPAETTLLRLLRPFFPSRVGTDHLQVRRYIRLTAIGRGTLPVGAPSHGALTNILMSVGFTTGGRADHVYAPWSNVVGGGEAAIRLRNELQSFIRERKASNAVKAIIAKIEANSTW